MLVSEQEGRRQTRSSYQERKCHIALHPFNFWENLYLNVHRNCKPRNRPSFRQILLHLDIASADILSTPQETYFQSQVGLLLYILLYTWDELCICLNINAPVNRSQYHLSHSAVVFHLPHYQGVVCSCTTAPGLSGGAHYLCFQSKHIIVASLAFVPRPMWLLICGLRENHFQPPPRQEHDEGGRVCARVGDGGPWQIS